MDAKELARLDRQLRLLRVSGDPESQSFAPFVQEYLMSALVEKDPSLDLSMLSDLKPGELGKFLDSQSQSQDPIGNLLTELGKPRNEQVFERDDPVEVKNDPESAAAPLEAEARAIRAEQRENDVRLEESRRALDNARLVTGRNASTVPGQSAELGALGQDTSALNIDPQVEISPAPVSAVTNNITQRRRANAITNRESNARVGELQSQADFVRNFERNLDQTRKTIEKALLQGLSVPRDTKEGSDPNG